MNALPVNDVDEWWKDAVVYCVDVESYLDTDANGTGDLSGLIDRIDHLAELGIDCLWLMPFHPTPGRDDGYDITDFYGVDHRLGSLGDFAQLVRTAHRRGIKVVIDLVVNHTSIDHPWFQEARSSVDNPFRDYYVWREDEPPDTSEMVVFHDEEKGIWSRDEITGHWYLHRFYRHQPDLNLSHPRVREEIAKIVGFWVQLGVDGFRVDAVPQLLTVGLRDEIENERGFVDPHGFLRRLRTFMNRRTGDAILLGEVNLPYEEQRTLFGTDGEGELTLVFDFVAMQNMYLSLARQDATAFARALRGRPGIPESAAWATFVRNHDELTLDQLTEEEREEVFAAFGPREEMQVYGRGLKRRLPPMLDGDPDRIRMVYSLLFSLPGTPTLFYGEEIGMGEDLGAEGRAAVRTPMQWTAGPNAGFSPVAPDDLTSPVVSGEHGPAHVNVEAQRRNPDSLWSFFVRLVRRYREVPELARGDLRVLDVGDPRVLVHVCEWRGTSTVAVHNLGPAPVTLEAPVPGERVNGAALVDVLAPDSEHRIDVGPEGTAEIRVGRFGYHWFRVL